MLRMALVPLVCLGIFASGCRIQAKPPADSNKQADFLPRGATNIAELGNGWLAFSLEIDGTTRRFLYHRETYWVMDSTFGFESITELGQHEATVIPDPTPP